MRTLLALGNGRWLTERAPNALCTLRSGNQIARLINGGTNNTVLACPKCKSTSIIRGTILVDERSAYEEKHASCSQRLFIWREIYEDGCLVKCINMMPQPVIKPHPIKVIKKCPYCGKYCDAKTGFPFLFETWRMRYYAHQECAGIDDLSKPTPFGPPYE